MANDINATLSLAEPPASRASAADNTTDGQNKSSRENKSVADHHDEDNSDDDAVYPVFKRMRHNSPQLANDVSSFTSGAVGNKYVVIKGVKPGIYCDL
jgi:hypothetical protein